MTEKLEKKLADVRSVNPRYRGFTVGEVVRILMRPRDPEDRIKPTKQQERSP